MARVRDMLAMQQLDVMTPVRVVQRGSINTVMAKYNAANQSILIDVVLGILFNPQHQLLIALRPKGVDQGNVWELPGGKVASGEAIESALIREMREEIGIEVKRCQPIMSVRHRYPNHTVRLQVFRITHYWGDVVAAEGQPLRWVAIETLHTIAFPTANRPIIDWLQSYTQHD